MKPRYTFIRRNGHTLIALAMPILSCSLDAAPVTWANSGTDFNSGASWVGAIAPGTTDIATFTGAKVTDPVLSAPATVGGLAFSDALAANYTISGNTITLGNSGIDATALSSGTNSITSNLTLAAGTQTWNVGTGTTLALSTGTFTRGTSSTLLVDQSVNTGLVTTTNIANTNGIVGAWAAVLQSGAAANNASSGYTFATVNVSQQLVSYTGATPLTTNYSFATNAAANYDVGYTGNITYGSSRVANTVRHTGGTVGLITNSTQTWGFNGLMNSGVGNLTFGASGNIFNFTAGAGTGTQLVLAPQTGNITFGPSARINNNASASGLLVAGQQSVTIQGANNGYTGGTIINSGTLQVSGAGHINTSSGITINGGKYLYITSTASTRDITLNNGTIDGTGTAGAATTVADNTSNVIANGNGGTTPLTFGTLTFNGDATLNLNHGASTPLAVTGALTTTPANGQVVVNVPNSFSNGTVNLISFGSFAGSASDFTVNMTGLNGRQAAGAPYVSGGNLSVDVSGESVVWSGASDDVWDAVTTGDDSSPNNWVRKTAHTATNFWTGDNVEFNDTYTIGSTTTPVTQTSVYVFNASPTSTTFNNSAVNYTLQGVGIAAGTLTKNGSGMVTLTNTNTYTGVTTINSGTLQLGDGITDGSFANTSSVTNNGTLAYNWVNNHSANHPISGTGKLTKSGVGTLTLNPPSANTFSGGITVSEGALSANANGVGNSAISLSLATGTTWNINGLGTYANTVSSSGAANVNFIAGGAAATLTGNWSAFSGTYTHAIGSQSTVFGSATATNANIAYVQTASGSSQGLLFGVTGGATYHLGSVATTLPGAVIRNAAAVTGSSVAEIGALNADTTWAGVIGGGGGTLSVTKVGSGTLTLSGTNVYNGDTTVSAGSLVLADNAQLRFAPTANGVSNKITGIGSATFDGDFNIVLTGANLTDNNEWTLVNVSTKTFSSTFSVVGFTAQGDGVTHTFVDGLNTWTFSETTGVLKLDIAPASAYAAWAGTQGLSTGVNDGPTQDPENDGIENALEFVLGGNPLTSDTSKLPTLMVTATNFVFTFNRADDSEAEVTLTFQHGSDLTGWTDVAIGADNATSGSEVNVVEDGANPDQITVTIPKGANTKLFGRLKAVK